MLLSFFFRAPLNGPREIDGLRVPQGKAYKLLTDHLITVFPFRRSEYFKRRWFKSDRPYIYFGLFGSIFFKHLLDVMVSYIG